MAGEGMKEVVSEWTIEEGSPSITEQVRRLFIVSASSGQKGEHLGLDRIRVFVRCPARWVATVFVPPAGGADCCGTNAFTITALSPDPNEAHFVKDPVNKDPYAAICHPRDPSLGQ